MALCSPEMYARFKRWICASFVDLTAECSWCPKPGCGRACKYDVSGFHHIKMVPRFAEVHQLKICRISALSNRPIVNLAVCKSAWRVCDCSSRWWYVTCRQTCCHRSVNHFVLWQQYFLFQRAAFSRHLQRGRSFLGCRRQNCSRAAWSCCHQAS